MSHLARWILWSLIVALAAILAWLAFSPAPPADDRVPTWREALAWNFAAGEHPRGWGWGERRFHEGALALRDTTGGLAVYVMPIAHAPEFTLAAEFMLVADAAGGPVGALLGTRDDRGRTHESACSVRAGRDELTLRHRVDRVAHLRELVPLGHTVERGRWYRLRFQVVRGEMTVYLDGRQVFTSDERYPLGLYSEPYLAAEHGLVLFREIQVLDLPRARGAVSGRSVGD